MYDSKAVYLAYAVGLQAGGLEQVRVVVAQQGGGARVNVYRALGGGWR